MSMSKKWTEKDVSKVLELVNMLNVVSLNQQLPTRNPNAGGDETPELGDIIPDTENDPQDIVEQHDKENILRKALLYLGPREQKIIELRYGLADGIARTLEEVAQMYGVTRERIRQVERRALQKLKIALRVKLKLKQGDIE